MANTALSRRVEKVVAYPPLSEMSDLQHQGKSVSTARNGATLSRRTSRGRPMLALDRDCS